LQGIRLKKKSKERKEKGVNGDGDLKIIHPKCLQ